ncbi:nudix family protein [Stemphylium lycopersici]|nr:nudix family protein [Stemphylium lycopersici]
MQSNFFAVLMILRPKDNREERYVVLTKHPRFGASSTAVIGIPAGTSDDNNSGDIIGEAVQMIEDKTGFRVSDGELVDMTALALEQARIKKHLASARSMSQANGDKQMSLLLWEKDMERTHLEKLKSKFSGQPPRDNLVNVRIRNVDMFWKEGASDANTLAAWGLYGKLSRDGTLEDRLGRIRAGQGWR